jgi:hypothetical protein
VLANQTNISQESLTLQCARQSDQYPALSTIIELKQGTNCDQLIIQAGAELCQAQFKLGMLNQL